MPLVEITFRTEAAEEAIRAIAEHVPNILVGAGSVRSLQQAEAAVDSGAKFLVSPASVNGWFCWQRSWEFQFFQARAHPQRSNGRSS
jgi:KDPG and KHG aldolase